MATLRDIRRRIGAVRNTAKITSAMKMVSAAKMRRAQNAIENARPYFSKLEDTVSNLISIADDYS
ncbi:MAG TPA: FoF1 ATP synthase subunit gamma, partial [Candidatus Kapabacteria bacterium]|nr:FoF1 ATP synthase subunit gamma [Candidatus Kapabacteria bacterium]